MTRLREIAERLGAIAAELEGEGELEEGRAATLAAEAGELSQEAVEETNRRAREAAAADASRHPLRAPRGPPLMYPEDLRDLVDAALAELRFSPAPRTAGLEEAMRYSLLAGGKRVRPVLALATARALGAPPERFLPVASRDRADPHLLADPRRPAGDGRRRPAPRQADLPQALRRGRRDPRRRRPLRRGGAPLLRAARRPGPGAGGAARAGRRDRGRRHGRRPVRRRDRRRARRRGPARAARAEDRPADLRQRLCGADPRGNRRK